MRHNTPRGTGKGRVKMSNSDLMIFSPHRPRSLFGSLIATMVLIHQTTVKDLRLTHRSPIMGLLMTFMQSVIMLSVFLLMFYVLGVRRSPIPGSFLLYIMSGIFMFMTYNMAMGAVAGAPGSASSAMLHAPMNPLVAIASKALVVLYNQTLSAVVLLYLVHVLVEPIHIDNLKGVVGMFLLAWLSGCALGLVFYAATPWAPTPLGLLKTFFMRLNMVASGKMFVANMLPAKMIAMFEWNPLFHIVDQTRGFAFSSYNPYFSSYGYAIKVTLVLFVVGMMGEFVTRQHASASWGKR